VARSGPEAGIPAGVVGVLIGRLLDPAFSRVRSPLQQRLRFVARVRGSLAVWGGGLYRAGRGALKARCTEIVESADFVGKAFPAALPCWARRLEKSTPAARGSG
jgi:hypothetical protein